MAFEAKPGSFSLFKNDKKEKDTHPDYRGDGMTPDGTPVWVSAWIKEGKNGKFMSCSMTPKDEQVTQPTKSKPVSTQTVLDESDVPF